MSFCCLVGLQPIRLLVHVANIAHVAYTDPRLLRVERPTRPQSLRVKCPVGARLGSSPVHLISLQWARRADAILVDYCTTRRGSWNEVECALKCSCVR